MRSIMIFGAIFCFWMAGLSIYESFRNLSILKRGDIIAAVLAQKPKRYVPYRSGFKGKAIYHYQGIEFQMDMREDEAGQYKVGDSMEFLHYSVYKGVFLNRSETISRQYWTVVAGILFALFGSLGAWYWLVGIKRIEKRQTKQMNRALLLPNGKRRKKVKYSHTVLKAGKRKERD